MTELISEKIKQTVSDFFLSEDAYSKNTVNMSKGKKKRKNVEVGTVGPEPTEDVVESAEVFLDESTGEQYYYELDEETLEERKIVIRVTSKGERIKRVTCGNGRIAKKVNGKIVCVTPTGRERLTKKLAMKRAVRHKKAKGAGYKKRVNFKRQKALRKRKLMGLGKQQ